MVCRRIACVLLAGLLLFPTGLPAGDVQRKWTEPPSAFEDSPELLVPRRHPSEAEKDQVTAATLYAHGRMLFQREDYARALRLYQRAWRYDPQAVSILSEIPLVAFSLKRHDEAARYAVLAAEADPADPLQLQRLAMFLTEQEQYARALRLYEKSLELQKDKDADGSEVLIHFEMGRLYLLNGDYQKSAESFARVRDALSDAQRFGLNEELKKAVLGDASRTYTLFGESFFQADRLEAAAEYFRKADEAKPDAALLALQLARVAAKRKQTEAALGHLEQYFEAGSTAAGTQPYELLGELIQAKLGDEAMAQNDWLARLEKLYDTKPNTVLGFVLARQAQTLDRLDLAERIYNDLLKDKSAIDVYVALVDVYRRQEKLDRLVDTLGKAVVRLAEVTTTVSLETLGDQANEVSKDAELISRLIDHVRQLRQTDPQSLGPGVSLAMGLLSIKATRFDDADAFFEGALQESAPPKLQVLSTWGLEMFLADQNERAARIFQRGIDEKLAPADNLDFYFYLTGALEMAGKTEEAVATAQQAISQIPKSKKLSGRIPWIQFHSRLPWVLYHAKQYAAAEENYRALLKQFEADYSSSLVREVLRTARLVLSNICVLEERFPEAEEWLEQVLDEFPEDIGALNDLGYLWTDQNKRLLRALDMVQKAVAGEPENAAYRDSLGWAYFRLGRYKEAVKELETAAEGEDPDGVILDHLGDAYFKANDRRRALATWKRAVEAFRQQDETKFLEKTEGKIRTHSAE